MSLRTTAMFKIIYWEDVHWCFSSCCATKNCLICQQMARSSWCCERTARLPNLCDSIPFTSPCAKVIVSEVNVAPQGCRVNGFCSLINIREAGSCHEQSWAYFCLKNRFIFSSTLHELHPLSYIHLNQLWSIDQHGRSKQINRNLRKQAVTQLLQRVWVDIKIMHHWEEKRWWFM